jgi:hypothetical protein
MLWSSTPSAPTTQGVLVSFSTRVSLVQASALHSHIFAVQVSCPVVASPAATSAAHTIVAGAPAYPAPHSTPQLAPATSDTPSPQPPLSTALTPAPKV